MPLLTQDEIKEKIDPESFLGFENEVYLTYLDFNHAKDYLKEGLTEKEWRSAFKGDGKPYPPVTEEDVTADMYSYMDFAIGKAVDHRGISASRSVDKMKAWMTILKREDEINWNWYAQYGAPILKSICDLMGWQDKYENLSEWDKPKFLRMAEGQRCTDDCPEGCE